MRGIALASVLAYIVRCEYSYTAVAAAVVMYYLRQKRITEYTMGSIVLSITNSFQLCALLGLPLICFYNGERGRNMRYLFYVFYPLHLLVLAQDKINKKGHHPAEITDQAACVGCASCATMCPDCVIKIEKEDPNNG